MRLRIGQVDRRKAAALALLLIACGCAAPPASDAAPAAEDAPMMVMPRSHHDAMRARAEEYCASFDGEPELIDWRYRSTFGKRGEWRLQAMWVCREAGE
jgi:hypothetical protein